MRYQNQNTNRRARGAARGHPQGCAASDSQQVASGVDATSIAEAPSLRDGFNGAGDAARLERYAQLLTTVEELRAGYVQVQCTGSTRDMLRRAGYKRCRTFMSYPVAVVWDRFNRLQLAGGKGVAV